MALVVAASITLLVTAIPIEISSLIVILLLVGLLIVIFSLRGRILYNAMLYKYHLLLANSQPPYKVKENFDNKWVDKLITMGFQYGEKHDYVDVLYRISKPIDGRKWRVYHVLDIVAIIKDNEIGFYSDILNDFYKKIWMEHEAKYHISKQVILQFKMYDEFSEEHKVKLDEIIAFREGINYLITINAGYFMKKNTFYFLHSKDYYPNIYYKYAVDLIESIVKKA